ncbi:MAG: MBL fold metallo-hydrolase [Spirochaetales bacterium]|nr:MBL fold metallo-hydrolase [Spirochaetales bacterium]
MNQSGFEYDTFAISGKNLTISFIGHGTLMLEYDNKIIHVDPVSAEADYSTLPKADIILITHAHGDHLEGNAISKIKKEDTLIIGSEESIKIVKEGHILKNGEKGDFLGIQINAVPAYNTTPGRDKYHPKGRDNGYILDFNGKRVYIAGDTEDTQEMMALKGIDIAFLPMNQPYTMTPEQVARAAKTFRPKVLYPYHFGSTDTSILLDLLKDETDIEVRIRKLD